MLLCGLSDCKCTGSSVICGLFGSGNLELVRASVGAVVCLAYVAFSGNCSTSGNREVCYTENFLSHGQNEPRNTQASKQRSPQQRTTA